MGTTDKIVLSDRLSAIAEMVRTGGRICDVGCDHAHIPIWLIKEGRISGALGMDVIPGPLEKAKENLSRFNCRGSVELRQSDGLDAYVPGEAQSLIISGMGGRIMAKILLREPDKTKSFEEMILQPQADPERVRAAVYELGFVIDDETMVTERGKYYPVIHAVRDVSGAGGREISDTELFFGPVLLKKRDADLHSFLIHRREVTDRILQSMEESAAANEEFAVRREQTVLMKDRIGRALLFYDKNE